MLPQKYPWVSSKNVSQFFPAVLPALQGVMKHDSW